MATHINNNLGGSGNLGWGLGDDAFHHTGHRSTELAAATQQQQISPEQQFRQLQNLLGQEAQGHEISFSALSRFFSDIVEAYQNNLGFHFRQSQRQRQNQQHFAEINQLIRSLSQNPNYVNRLQPLLTEFDRIQGYLELEETLRSGTSILGRDNFERMGVGINLGASLAGRAGSIAGMLLGLRGNAGLAMASGLANAWFQNGLHLTHAYGQGRDFTNKEIAGELGDSALSAMACSLLSVGLGAVRGKSTLWSVGLFAADVMCEFVISEASPVKYLLGLETRGLRHGWKAYAYGVVANALGEILRDGAGHLVQRAGRHAVIPCSTRDLHGPFNLSEINPPVFHQNNHIQNPSNHSFPLPLMALIMPMTSQDSNHFGWTMLSFVTIAGVMKFTGAFENIRRMMKYYIKIAASEEPSNDEENNVGFMQRLRGSAKASLNQKLTHLEVTLDAFTSLVLNPRENSELLESTLIVSINDCLRTIKFKKVMLKLDSHLDERTLLTLLDYLRDQKNKTQHRLTILHLLQSIEDLHEHNNEFELLYRESLTETYLQFDNIIKIKENSFLCLELAKEFEMIGHYGFAYLAYQQLSTLSSFEKLPDAINGLTRIATKLKDSDKTDVAVKTINHYADSESSYLSLTRAEALFELKAYWESLSLVQQFWTNLNDQSLTEEDLEAAKDLTTSLLEKLLVDNEVANDNTENSRVIKFQNEILDCLETLYKYNFLTTDDLISFLKKLNPDNEDMRERIKLLQFFATGYLEE